MHTHFPTPPDYVRRHVVVKTTTSSCPYTASGDNYGMGSQVLTTLGRAVTGKQIRNIHILFTKSLVKERAERYV